MSSHELTEEEASSRERLPQYDGWSNCSCCACEIGNEEVVYMHQYVNRERQLDSARNARRELWPSSNASNISLRSSHSHQLSPTVPKSSKAHWASCTRCHPTSGGGRHVPRHILSQGRV